MAAWCFLAGFAVASVLALPLALVIRRRLRQSQEYQRRAREAEGLAMLGRLAGGLAHEIRNPLSTMRVNLQLLQEDWAHASTSREERTRHKIDILQEEAERLEEILNDFLRYARGHKLNPTRVNLNDVLSDLIAFFEPQALQHKINLRQHLAPDLPPALLDVDLIKQAFLNLMINAQQAMPQGGELIVTTRRDHDTVLADIIDTGTGIDPAIRAQIFQAYFSAKRTGTGLGLALTKRIIEEHRGRIEVTSEVGKGSDFRVLLPLAPTEEPQAGNVNNAECGMRNAESTATVALKADG